MKRKIEEKLAEFPFPDYDPGNKIRLKRMMAEFRKGFDFLKKMEKERVVSIFGSHLDKKGDREYEQARNLGQLLAKEKIVVLTGGGPGIMEAANRGAFEAGGRSIGINLELGDREKKNKYVKESAYFHYLFVRRVMLAHAGQAYVFFPGGFGTLDEFFEIATLVVTRKILHRIPIILVGKDYWYSLREWLQKVAVEHYQTIPEKEFYFWKIVADEKEAFNALRHIPFPILRHESV